jgi:hypothetical protein
MSYRRSFTSSRAIISLTKEVVSLAGDTRIIGGDWDLLDSFATLDSNAKLATVLFANLKRRKPDPMQTWPRRIHLEH